MRHDHNHDRNGFTSSFTNPESKLLFFKWKEEKSIIIKERKNISQGGGIDNIDKQHKKKRLTARERIKALLDRNTKFYEIGQYAGFNMYSEWGGAPAAGVICGLGYIENHICMIIANDATVKAGAFFPMTSKKVIRAQTIAYENYLPTVYLVDSSGIFLPLQEDVFPDQDDFGRIFYLNAKMSAKGIPQITAIMGMCVAGGAYLPVMTDKVIMTEGSGLFLAGPALVKAAIGQVISSEDLGGARIHDEISGTIDFKENDDLSAIRKIRNIVLQLGTKTNKIFQKRKERAAKYPAQNLYHFMPFEITAEYNIHDVINHLVDAAEFIEYRKNFGKTLVCGYAYIGGYSVGIIANQKKNLFQKGQQPLFGGVIYSESAEKASRFIMDCNQSKIPLLFIHDVNGFMVGRDAEYDGIIKAGAKMVNVVSNSVVPKISLIIGGTFGAGNYAMCGKAYAPDFIFAWPTAKYSVMGGTQAANTLLDIKVKQMERGGQNLSEENKKHLLESIIQTYNDQMNPRYGAARLWVDEIILPEETRERLIISFEAVSNRSEIEPFKTGILQT